jgi:hypothetical protein
MLECSINITGLMNNLVCTAATLKKVTKTSGGHSKKSATANLSSPLKESMFNIDVDCPTMKGLVGRLTFQSDATWEAFLYAVAKKMNQHVENIEIGYKLSIDDTKQGTRQLNDAEDFESMI